jgi:cytochrome c6
MKPSLAVTLVFLSLAAASLSAAPAAENWTNLCAKCHGADGAGKTVVGKKLKVKDYSDAAVQAAMKDDDMLKAIKEGISENGKDKMKAFTELSDEDAKALVAHIRTLKK